MTKGANIANIGVVEAAKGEQVTMSNDIQMKTLSRRAMLLKTAGGLGAASLVALSDSSPPARSGKILPARGSKGD